MTRVSDLDLVKDAILSKMAGPLFAHGPKLWKLAVVSGLNGIPIKQLENYIDKEARKIIGKSHQNKTKR
jgi:hypothetical protein